MPLYGHTFYPYSTEENGHELNQRSIIFLQYVHTVLNVYFKNQVEKQSKIDNSVNNQKSKISKSNFSKACKEKRKNMLSRNHEPYKLILTIKYYSKYSRY